MSIQKRFSGFSDNKNRKDEYDGYHGAGFYSEVQRFEA